MLTHTGERPYACKYCQQRFSGKSNCKVHERTHANKNKLRWKNYDVQPHLKHNSEESEISQIESESSGDVSVIVKPTLNADVLEKLGRPVTEEESKQLFVKLENSTDKDRIQRPFICLVCGKNEPAFPGMLIHVRTHTGEKPFQCPYCYKQFARKHTCDQHVRSHTGEKPYHCTFCPKKFSIKLSCDVHIRTHTGERPYTCNYCPKQFTNKQNCDKHMRVHTGEKPYACTHCPKKFADKKTCDRHILTHTGEKPFQCRYCHMKFINPGNCKKHEKTHLKKLEQSQGPDIKTEPSSEMIEIKLEPSAEGHCKEGMDEGSGNINTEDENWIEIKEEPFVDDSDPLENF